MGKGGLCTTAASLPYRGQYFLYLRDCTRRSQPTCGASAKTPDVLRKQVEAFHRLRRLKVARGPGEFSIDDRVLVSGAWHCGPATAVEPRRESPGCALGGSSQRPRISAHPRTLNHGVRLATVADIRKQSVTMCLPEVIAGGGSTLLAINAAGAGERQVTRTPPNGGRRAAGALARGACARVLFRVSGEQFATHMSYGKSVTCGPALQLHPLAEDAKRPLNIEAPRHPPRTIRRRHPSGSGPRDRSG